MSENFFIDNDENVKFYTGLNCYAHLKIVFESVSSDISVTPQSALTAFQQMLLTLMKLRHDYPFKDLADQFAVSAATCISESLKCSVCSVRMACKLANKGRTDSFNASLFQGTLWRQSHSYFGLL